MFIRLGKVQINFFVHVSDPEDPPSLYAIIRFLANHLPYFVRACVLCECDTKLNLRLMNEADLITIRLLKVIH